MSGLILLLVSAVLSSSCAPKIAFNLEETSSGYRSDSTSENWTLREPTPDVRASARDYLDNSSAILNAFDLITDELVDLDTSSREAMIDQCELIVLRLEETVEPLVLLEVTIGIPDEVIVDLYASSMVARVAALDACLAGDGEKARREIDEAKRVSEVISSRLGAVGASS